TAMSTLSLHDALPICIQAASMGNSKLRWERNATTNVGVDYTLFHSRIFGSIEAYHRTSKDLLLSKPIVWAAGYSEITENLGEVRSEEHTSELQSRENL